MGLIDLDIYPRTTSGKNANRRQRAAGRLPAVIYGKDREAAKIELDAHDFAVTLRRLGGRAAIFKITGEEDVIALLREVQTDPVTDELLHVDLMEIPRGRPVVVNIPVQVVGTCQAIKAGDASVALAADTIEISCRPQELPDAIEIDISDLELNDKVFAGDIKPPVGEVISDPEMLVLNIRPSTLVLEEPEEELEGEEGAEAAEGGEEGASEASGDADED